MIRNKKEDLRITIMKNSHKGSQFRKRSMGIDLSRISVGVYEWDVSESTMQDIYNRKRGFNF